MKRAIKILAYCLVVIVAFLITYNLLVQEEQTFFVAKEYQDSFAATCAVVTSADVLFKHGGTGVLLNNGMILSAKHIADANRDGIISGNERDVWLKFYYPKKFTSKGRVVYVPPEKNIIARGFDFIIIKPEAYIKSNIRLTSIDEQMRTGAGEEIYTIGRTDAHNPPHFIFGNQSTNIDGAFLYDRVHLPIWYGNSGGGVFRKDNGALLGVMIIKKDASVGFMGPMVWSGYMSATNIRLYLRANGAEHFVQTIQDTAEYKIQKYLKYYFIFLSCFLGVYFGLPILREKVRDMRRDDASL